MIPSLVFHFPGNQIPATRIDSAATALLPYIPLPNLPGASRNFHNATTAETSHPLAQPARDSQLHALPPAAAASGVEDLPDAAARRGSNQAQQGTSVTMTAQFQYRRGDSELVNVLPALGGRSTTSSLTAPVSLDIRHKRSMYNINFNVSQTSARTTQSVRGARSTLPGWPVSSGASTDAFDWGIPSLSFSSLSSLYERETSRQN